MPNSEEAPPLPDSLHQAALETHADVKDDRRPAAGSLLLIITTEECRGVKCDGPAGAADSNLPQQRPYVCIYIHAYMCIYTCIILSFLSIYWHKKNLPPLFQVKPVTPPLPVFPANGQAALNVGRKLSWCCFMFAPQMLSHELPSPCCRVWPPPLERVLSGAHSW